jgi:hypothetical protein
VCVGYKKQMLSYMYELKMSHGFVSILCEHAHDKYSISIELEEKKNSNVQISLKFELLHIIVHNLFVFFIDFFRKTKDKLK